MGESNGGYSIFRLCPARFLHRRRSLQAPAGLRLAPALACGSGSAPAVRRDLAMVKAGDRRSDERERSETQKADQG
jgi:hypothetical protein